MMNKIKNIRLPIPARLFKSVLKSKILIITSIIFFCSFLILNITTIRAASNSNDAINGLLYVTHYLNLGLIVLYLTFINVWYFSKFYLNDYKLGTVALEIRSGINRSGIFWERVLVNKVFSIGSIIFFVITFAIVAGANDLSVYYQNFTRNALWGCFLVTLIFDLTLTGVILVIFYSGSAIWMGVISTLLFLIFALNPILNGMANSLNETSDVSYSIAKSHLSYKTAQDIRTLEKDNEEGVIHNILKDFFKFNDYFEQNLNRGYFQNIDDAPSILNLFDYGLIADFTKENEYTIKIPKENVDSKEKSDESEKNEYVIRVKEEQRASFEKNSINILFSKINSLHGKVAYNKANRYGLEYFDYSYYAKDPKIRNKYIKKVNFNTKYNIFDLIDKIESDDKQFSDEEKELANIIANINRYVFAEDQNIISISDPNLSFLLYDLENSTNNQWLESTSSSIGVRYFTRGLTFAITQALNIPGIQSSGYGGLNQYTYNDYIKFSKNNLRFNPFVKLLTIAVSDYNKYGEYYYYTSVKRDNIIRPLINRELEISVDKEKVIRTDKLTSYDESNYIKIEDKGKIMNPIIAVIEFLIIDLALIILGFYLFKRKINI